MNTPPFLVSFSDPESFKMALQDEARSNYLSEIDQLIARRLPPVVSVRVLATLFGFSSRFVGAIRMKPQRYYRTFFIRKGQKKREIHAPKVALKVIQKWIAFHLSRATEFSPSVYGFIEGKSAVLAATVHCRSEWVYSLDIKDFFPSTSHQKVLEAVNQVGYSIHSARLLADLCCYNGGLAQGSPASPVLSNLVFKPYDAQLEEIARHFGVRFTRYADDIVFSGSGSPPEGLQEKVRHVIANGGWSIAASKEKLSQLPHRLKVHGLLVHGTSPRLTKGYRNRIRAFRHLTQMNNIKPEDSERIQGHLAYDEFIRSHSRQEPMSGSR